ncbi:hypothetical protein F5Y16DRAFT_383664 [Xylariaceae sp. FL0255]|nr:hypothetical protein F5Y16DRAFT_383664 [Xylariaceae sp. FL0255]
MERGNTIKSSFRQPAFLDREPTYCAIDDHYDNEIAAKRARYEYHGRRYLEGRPLRILSATLRGPFNNASGWRNPWLPSAPSQPTVSSKLSPAPPVLRQPAKRPLRAEPIIQSDIHSEGEEDDSMECHLPSPESAQDLEFFLEPSTSQKRSHIEAWAKDVPADILDHDEFWAPNLELLPHTHQRPVPNGTAWLKRRPPKRFRPTQSQSTATASTPTPIATSDHGPKRKKEPQATKMTASRNFEMTTPSSSPDEKEKKPFTLNECNDVPKDDDNDESPVIPISTARSEISVQTPLRDVSDDETVDSLLMSQKQLEREQLEYLEANEEENGFQSCTDDSFNYRARRTAQSAPPAMLTDENGLSSQFGVEPLGVGSDVTAPPLVKDVDDSNHIERCMIMNLESSGMPTTKSVSSHEKRETSAVPRKRPISEFLLGKPSLDDDGDLSTSSLSSLSSADEKALLDSLREPYAADYGLTAILGIKEEHDSQHALPIVSESGSPQAFVDEGPTLVGDEMELDGDHDFQVPSCDHISQTEIVKEDDTLQCARDTAVKIVPTSRGEDTNSQSSGLSSPPLSPTETSYDISNNPMLGQNDMTFQSMDKSGNNGSQKPNQMTVPATTGSDPETTVHSQQHFNYSITELASKTCALLKSPTRFEESPAIRPSQQSPWAEDNFESVTIKSSRVFVDVNLCPPLEREPSSIPCDSIQTPSQLNIRQLSPEPMISVKSFATFELSSPQQPRSQRTSNSCGILASGKFSNPKSSIKSNRRVSFAPLPHEQADEDYHLSSPTRMTRAASPPPAGVVELDGENVDGRYRNHFEAMNSRIENLASEDAEAQKQLLPSFSQQKVASPSVEAMAEAFREADALQSSLSNEVSGIDGVHDEDLNVVQSPWQHQSQEVDHVADVMANLDDFLNVWDVDQEMDRHRAELEIEGLPGTRSFDDIARLGDAGPW